MSDTKDIKPKKGGRQSMAEQPPLERVRNFFEVPLGYTPEQAMLEAARCIQCKKPLCVGGCPVNINIPWFVRLIAEGKFSEAARKIKETNGLPAVCGRVCPQEDQCEKVCIIGKKGEPVSIGRLERFAADYEREHGEAELPEIPRWTGKRRLWSGPARRDLRSLQTSLRKAIRSRSSRPCTLPEASLCTASLSSGFRRR